MSLTLKNYQKFAVTLDGTINYFFSKSFSRFQSYRDHDTALVSMVVLQGSGRTAPSTPRTLTDKK